MAIENIHNQSEQLSAIAHLLKGDSNSLVEKVKAALDKSRQLEKEILQLKDQQASQESASIGSKAKDVKGIKLLVSQLSNTDPKLLRTMVDDLKNQLKSAIIVLSTTSGDKVSMIVGVTNDLTAKVKAGDLISFIAGQVGGKGGGRPDMAQAGGTDVNALPAAMASVEEWVESRL